MIIKKLAELPVAKVSHNPKVSKQCILDHEACPPLTQFAQAIFPPGETAPAHSHSDMTEVFFVQSGHGKIIVDQHEVPLSPGTTVTVEPNESHEVINDSEDELVLLYFGISH